jgi:hypothetical protein
MAETPGEGAQAPPPISGTARSSRGWRSYLALQRRRQPIARSSILSESLRFFCSSCGLERWFEPSRAHKTSYLAKNQGVVLARSKFALRLESQDQVLVAVLPNYARFTRPSPRGKAETRACASPYGQARPEQGSPSLEMT